MTINICGDKKYDDHSTSTPIVYCQRADNFNRTEFACVCIILVPSFQLMFCLFHMDCWPHFFCLPNNSKPNKFNNFAHFQTNCMTNEKLCAQQITIIIKLFVWFYYTMTYDPEEILWITKIHVLAWLLFATETDDAVCMTW